MILICHDLIRWLYLSLFVVSSSLWSEYVYPVTHTYLFHSQMEQHWIHSQIRQIHFHYSRNNLVVLPFTIAYKLCAYSTQLNFLSISKPDWLKCITTNSHHLQKRNVLMYASFPLGKYYEKDVDFQRPYFIDVNISVLLKQHTTLWNVPYLYNFSRNPLKMFSSNVIARTVQIGQ